LTYGTQDLPLFCGAARLKRIISWNFSTPIDERNIHSAASCSHMPGSSHRRSPCRRKLCNLKIPSFGFWWRCANNYRSTQATNRSFSPAGPASDCLITHPIRPRQCGCRPYVRSRSSKRLRRVKANELRVIAIFRRFDAVRSLPMTSGGRPMKGESPLPESCSAPSPRNTRPVNPRLPRQIP
jgi:hypothetical protein